MENVPELLILSPWTLPWLPHFSGLLLRYPCVFPINSSSVIYWSECISTFHKPKEPQLRLPRNNDNEVFYEVLFNLRWSVTTAQHFVDSSLLLTSWGIPHSSSSLKFSLLRTHSTFHLFLFNAVVLNPGYTLESPGEPEKYLSPIPREFGVMGHRVPWVIRMSTQGWEPVQARPRLFTRAPSADFCSLQQFSLSLVLFSFLSAFKDDVCLP